MRNPYRQIQKAINKGEFDSAKEMLHAASERDAKWHFLMGSLFYRKGWLDEARQYFQKAADMEPNNRVYQQALARMQAGGSAYLGSRHSKGSGKRSRNCYCDWCVCDGCGGCCDCCDGCDCSA